MLKSKAEKIRNFDPNNLAAEDSNIFGLPFTAEESDTVLIPVPWEVTVSYGAGTARGPKVIMEASKQVDLFHLHIPDAWKKGVYMGPVPKDIYETSKKYRKKAEKIIDALGEGPLDKEMQALQADINRQSIKLNAYVQAQATAYLDQKKNVGLVGGDHSTPLGFIKALGERHKSFSVLQIDAHADLRKAYEGFTYSHASIMYNVLAEVPQVKKLVQVGIRDFCEEEYDLIQSSPKRIQTYFYDNLARERYEGRSWAAQVKDMVAQLGKEVYISFDIDGLDPKYCPNTGTPVPGGLEFHEAVYLIRSVAESGRRIIGFDLNEVGPSDDEWDANVGARLLFELCHWSALTK
ncbi:MAG: agmatinase family protein [Bacteroidia bacterium]|nr:agmatinase family protein [Bacteroidia bacterium]